MLDSSGKLPPGMLQGNVNQLGDFDQCLSIEENFENERENTEEIFGKYCLVSIDLQLPNSMQTVDRLIHSHYVIKSKLTDVCIIFHIPNEYFKYTALLTYLLEYTCIYIFSKHSKYHSKILSIVKSILLDQYSYRDEYVEVQKTRQIFYVLVGGQVMFLLRIFSITYDFLQPGHRIPKFASMYWALCVPHTCSNEDVKEAVISQLKKLQISGLKKDVSLEKFMCQTRNEKKRFTLGTVTTA